MKLKKGDCKKYNLERSPFYGVKSPHVLSRLLKINFYKLSKDSHLYKKYYKKKIPKGGGDFRDTETPYGELRRIHSRILTLFKRISVPEYLQSGIKGRSYVTNARAHLGSRESFCLDIRKFFPSTTRSHIYGFFQIRMNCGPQVSAILANLCSVDGHLPTGSPLSTLFSYFVHIEMFEELFGLSSEHGITMTVYVDDVVFSGNKVSKIFRNEVKQVIRKRGLRTHKHRYYRDFRAKEITGVIVDFGDLKLPQRRHFKLFQQLTGLWELSHLEDRIDGFKRALSRLSEGAQIEVRIANRRRSLLAAKPNIFRDNEGVEERGQIPSKSSTTASVLILGFVGLVVALIVLATM